MRLSKSLLALALVGQLLLSSAQAQQLTDGQCTVPLDAAQFKSLVTDAGVQEWVNFAIAAPFTSVSPVADGKLSANEYGNKCFITYAENQNPGYSHPGYDNLNDGDADLTTNLYFAHTDKALFVAFEVFDDFQETDSGASFQNDGVELFVNSDVDTGDPWGPGRFQIYVDAAGEGDVSGNHRGAAGGIQVNSDGDPQPGEFYSAGIAGQNSYVVEIQIPLESLNRAQDPNEDPIAAKTGDVVLINAAIDDNDAEDNSAAQNGHHLLWHFDGAAPPFGGGEVVWPVPLQLSPATAAGVPGDVNGSGALDAGDIDSVAGALRTGSTDSKYDLNKDGSVTPADHTYLVETLFKSYIGDSNLDKQFNSADFITVFQVGEYEDTSADNSTWAEGDWNGDADFDSSDFVAAFQAGGYEAGPRPAVSAVPEPSSVALMSLAGLALASLRRRRA